MIKEVKEINKILDNLIDTFRYILNKYIDLLEEKDDFCENKDWKKAMNINTEWFT